MNDPIIFGLFDDLFPKELFKHVYNQQAKRNHIVPNNDQNLDVLIPSELIASKGKAIFANLIWKPFLIKELTVSQFHNVLCVDISSRVSENMALQLEENIKEVLCHKISLNQVIVLHASNPHVLRIHFYALLAGQPSGQNCTNRFVGICTGWLLLKIAIQRFCYV